MPGGDGRIAQSQHDNWCLGYRSFTTHSHTFPIHFHYAIERPVENLRHVRTDTAAVMFHGAPVEWEQDWQGRQVETANFDHFGRVRVEEADECHLHFHAQALPEMSVMPTDEVSLNSFIPLHFGPRPRATLNDQPFESEPIQACESQAVCRVQDAGFVYEITYRFDRPIMVRLFRWANFLRLAAFFHEGKSHRFSAEELEPCQAIGDLRILETP